MTRLIQQLRESIAGVFLGKPEAVDRVICCLLARGHLLIEDVPGVGKTVLAMALARSIDCAFSRLQLTPDLLPSDILGVGVLKRETGTFEFQPGPIFANIVLADEINRTPPRTQTALLEAMSEGAVTVDGVTRPLPDPFMIVATQNPYDFEGTYMLPENQLDRFLMRISLGYPSSEYEAQVLEQRPAERRLRDVKPVMHVDDVLRLQQQTADVRMDRSLVDYIIKLASASRSHDDLRMGLSPRGSLALGQAARATAVMDGRDYVIPEDIVQNVVPVCSHRVLSRGYAPGRNGTGSEPPAAGVLRQILESLPSPA